MLGKIYPKSEIVFVEVPKGPKFINRTGDKFGRLTVLGFGGQKAGKAPMWYCECECGNVIKAQGTNLKSGSTKSCGCLHIENKTIHGHAKIGVSSPEYYTWKAMIQRTTNPKNKDYHSYGGRGISVCEEWRSFENFIANMGVRPGKDYSIERDDVNGNYCASNCRWATDDEQANNKRNSRLITYDGRTQTMTQWGRELGIDPETMTGRIDGGWSIEKAFTTPVALQNPVIILAYQGREQSMKQWASELGIKAGTIAARLNRGWSVEMALSESISQVKLSSRIKSNNQ